MATPASVDSVALTFDDLPIADRAASIDDATAITSKLLAGLVRNRLPATGFVNECGLEGADRDRRVALLEHWLEAGMDLGNHGYSHLSLTHTPVDEYIADAARGETVTRALLAERGRTERWYRPPYLETGPTPEVRHRVESWLASRGYRIAPVTMENSDWMFSLPYDDAVARRDRVSAERIRRAYFNHTGRIVAWYRQAALDLLGRRPAFVFMLHASRLNADCIDGLAGILRELGLHSVTLDQAMTDPAYAIADDYAGPKGDGWLTRWAATLHKRLPWETLPSPSEAIAAAHARLAAASQQSPPQW